MKPCPETKRCGGFMGSAWSDSEAGLSTERIYKKPTLKRHGLVSELTRGSSETGTGARDGYDGYSYTYSLAASVSSDGVVFSAFGLNVRLDWGDGVGLVPLPCFSQPDSPAVDLDVHLLGIA